MTLVFKASNATASDFVLLEPDLYEATFTRYELAEGQFGPSVKLFFDVANEGAEPVEVSGFCGLPKDGEHLNIKAKLRTWVHAILGRVLEEGEQIDLDALVGSRCRLDLDYNVKEAQDGTKRTYNKIVGIKPAKRQAQRPQQDNGKGELRF